MLPNSLDLAQRLRGEIALTAVLTADDWNVLDQERGPAFPKAPRHPTRSRALLAADVAHHVS
jgi:hypothetical protein